MTGQRAPMKMVAFGDSIVWGQGLRHEQKFVVQAARRIAAIEGTSLVGGDVELLAHSGAIIDSSFAEREAFTNRWAYLFGPDRNAVARTEFISGTGTAHHLLSNEAVPGELSRPYPTVIGQMRQYARANDATKVDVVFADGGGNDLDFTSFLHPTGDQRSDFEHVRNVLYPRYEALMKTALETFPNAVVILNGYYPLLSPDSDNERIKAMFYFFERLSWGKVWINDVYGSEGSRLALELGLVSLLGPLGVAIASTMRSETEDMIKLSEFVKARVWQMYQLVSTIMREVTTASHSSRLLFCEPFIGRENALFAPQSMVFEDYDPNAMRDAVVAERHAQAAAEFAQIDAYHGKGTLMRALADHSLGLPTDPHTLELARYFTAKLELWRQMSFLHPNPAGAQAFTSSIEHGYRLWRRGSLRASILPRGGSLRAENRLPPVFGLDVKAFELASKLDYVMLRIGGTYNFFQYFEGMFDLVLRLGLKVPKAGRGFVDVSLQREAAGYYTDAYGEQVYVPPDDFPFNRGCHRAYMVLVDKQVAAGGDGLYFADVAWIEIRGAHRPEGKPIYRRNEPKQRPPASSDQQVTRVQVIFDGLVPVVDSGVVVDFVPSAQGQAVLRFDLA